MSTFNGWTVITIPAYPPAPESIEFTLIDSVTLVRSPFTFSQQVYNWNASTLEASVTMPPLKLADAQNWFTFLQTLQGPLNVFQFSAAFVSAYSFILAGSSPLGGWYWRLAKPARKISLTHQRVFGLQFDVIKAQ